MLNVRLSALALVCAFVTSAAPAATLTEDFATDPLQNGWQVFGNTNLFQWDSTNHQIAVTWDSTQPNSFFYHPLNGYLTRYDDFGFEFDLLLNDAATGVEPGKTTALQVALGFLNQAATTNPNLVRGMGEYGAVSNIVEFDYYPEGYYEWPPGVSNDSPASVVPSFVSSASSFAPAWLNPYYVLTLPTNQFLHVSMSYTASNQAATIIVTANALPLGPLPILALNVSSNSYFAPDDDFRVDVFSISTYSAVDDPYNSLLAHGTVANLKVNLPPPAQILDNEVTNGVCQVRFSNKTNWLYTLERTTNFLSWSGVSPTSAGNGETMALQDLHAPGDRAFYRVRAERP